MPKVIKSLFAICFTFSTLVIIPASDAATNCKSITSREWKLIDKNPEASKKMNVWVYGKITQFNAATGPSVFRADISGNNEFDGKYFFNGTNTMLKGNSKTLAEFVTGDVFKACVMVLGEYSYQTALTKGQLTVPQLSIRTIKYIGSTD